MLNDQPEWHWEGYPIANWKVYLKRLNGALPQVFKFTANWNYSEFSLSTCTLLKLIH